MRSAPEGTAPATFSFNYDSFPFFGQNELFEQVRLGGIHQAEQMVAELVEYVRRSGPGHSYMLAEAVVVAAYGATFAGAPPPRVEEVLMEFWSSWDQQPTEATRPKALVEAVRQLCLLKSTASPSDCVLIAEAKRYMEQNYHRRSLELTEVANRVRLNSTYFSHIFKQRAGMSFSHHLNVLRLRKAMALLVDPALDVSEVAYKVGYSTLHYFTLMFRRFTGMTPTQYRQTLDTREPK